MQITLTHLKTTATRHAEQLRKVSGLLHLDMLEGIENGVHENDQLEAEQYAEDLNAIATVAGLLDAIPNAMNGNAMATLQGVVQHAEAFLARESTQATLRRAAEFERELAY